MEPSPDQLVERVTQRIADYILDDLGWDGSRESLTGAEPVNLTMVLDSTQLLELVGFVEDEYSVIFPDDEIVADTFHSARALAELVVGKRAADQLES